MFVVVDLNHEGSFSVLQKSCVSLILGGNDWERSGEGWARLQSRVDGPVTSAERIGADFKGIIRNQVWISESKTMILKTHRVVKKWWNRAKINVFKWSSQSHN